ncbi:hypothetical protein F5J12DRAFT_904254 [Pisolithus orientalis]|uniref:uncharacterized protein n=1 Tax=Pisolithus orientalis TaxID=936130 RepID=UPI002223FC3A|nr:uncharacterized protein F5J12DRAFT_904254 [Pisolithus orientalis]KAI6019891.1 hypothetical protein F5J12DRAFT_904254 [Pisolithus orientalis]
MLDNEEYAHGRRRSVDVGGLALALGNQALGHGWGGWDEVQQGETRCDSLHDTFFSYPLIPPETRLRLIGALDGWHFEPHKLPEEEVLYCAYILFESLFRRAGMHREIGVALTNVSIFLRHLRLLYCGQNSYHNFQHALDVLQACHAFLCAAGVVPPAAVLCRDERPWEPDRRGRADRLAFELSNMDLFALFIAAIGHDVGHPGLTNLFMKNANAPLSTVFDGKSALEHMHYTILIHAYATTWSLAGIVLATDMGVHFEFMKNFALLADGRDFPLDFKRLLFCQAIIKCADISNPSRPPGVSHYWADALMAEWTSQACLEKHWHLPPSVQPSSNPLGQVQGQIFFIDTFAKPLMDITARVVPEMQRFADQCTANLVSWQKEKARLTGSSDQADFSPSNFLPSSPRPPQDFLGSFPLTLPTFALDHPDESHLLPWQPPSPLHPPSDSGGQRMDASPPDSPAPSVSSGSFVLASPSSSRFRTMSSVSKSDAATAMRAAYQVGVRKKRSFYNRYSWTSDLSPVASSPNLVVAAIPKATVLVADTVGTVLMSSKAGNETPPAIGTVQ